MATLTVLDGADSVGGNKIHLEVDGMGYLLDFGTNYSRMGMFYEEYLRPRTTRGLHDFLEMGLVPPFDIYRDDAIPSDLDKTRLEPLRVDGVFLSHAHLDHAGCVGLLDLSIPVICTPTTAVILKAMQDSGRAWLPHEVAYATPREPLKREPRVTVSTHYKKTPNEGRQFLLTSSPPDGLKEFWISCPGSRGLSAKLLETAKTSALANFRWWDVDHSIYGSSAFALETDQGWVVYTGDLRLHGKRGPETEKFVEESSKLDVAVLIIEGTRVHGGGVGRESEEVVHEKCLTAVDREKKLVIADFQPRHFERLETFLKIAQETKRSLVVTPRDVYMLEAVKLVDGIDRVSDALVYYELKERRELWEERIIETYSDNLVDPEEIARDPGAYILCFSFWDIKNLLDIKPKGGTYVYSSSEAVTEEAEFDFIRLWEWLQKFGMEVVGFKISSSMGEAKPEFEPGYHASGHASGDELLEMIEKINPKVVVPVHTEHPEFFVEKVRRSSVLRLKNGQRFDLDEL